jgi:hypothetical protein
MERGEPSKNRNRSLDDQPGMRALLALRIELLTDRCANQIGGVLSCHWREARAHFAGFLAPEPEASPRLGPRSGPCGSGSAG